MPDSDLDTFLGRPPLSRGARPLGVVVGGSLSHGLEVMLDPHTVLEGLAVGRYVVIHGQTRKRFFGMVTDLSLGATQADLASHPPAADDAYSAEVLRGTAAYGLMHVAPMLELTAEGGEPRPIKTIPAHFAQVLEASEAEVNLVFGAEDRSHFHIGAPLEMNEVHVNLDLARLVERSSGVFGKSGTGKSFITRMLLAGVVRAGLASCLVFDMHNDYGWSVRDETGREYKGLRQLFSDGRVSVITLDPETSRHRQSKTDRELRISLRQIEPEDVELLAGLLGLSEIQVGALHFLRRRLGRDWIVKLLAERESDELKATGRRGTPDGRHARRNPTQVRTLPPAALPAGRPAGRGRRGGDLRPLQPGHERGSGVRQVRHPARSLRARCQLPHPPDSRPLCRAQEPRRGRPGRRIRARWSSSSRRPTNSSTRRWPGIPSSARSPASCASTT